MMHHTTPCGCTADVQQDGTIRLIHCPLHDSAPALLAACRASVPLLVRLGDFIGNGEPTDTVGSLGVRCDAIGAARGAIRAAEARVTPAALPTYAATGPWTPRRHYGRSEASTSRCPNCRARPTILYALETGPAFYICWACQEIRQIGVGLVTEPPDPEAVA